MLKESIKDLINAIAEGDSIAIEDSFNTVMASKISDRLDDMRVSVAQNMFGSVNESEDLVEATYASGEWHVIDKKDGGHYKNTIHSTHASARKAINAARKANEKDPEGDRYHAKAASAITNESLEDYSVEELEDFMMSEEFEQLDELSKATLGSYIKKAHSDTGKQYTHEVKFKEYGKQ